MSAADEVYLGPFGYGKAITGSDGGNFASFVNSVLGACFTQLNYLFFEKVYITSVIRSAVYFSAVVVILATCFTWKPS